MSVELLGQGEFHFIAACLKGKRVREVFMRPFIRYDDIYKGNGVLFDDWPQIVSDIGSICDFSLHACLQYDIGD